MRFGRTILKWIIISVLFLIVFSFVSDTILSNYHEVKRYTVTVTDKEKETDNNSTHYIIYTTLNNGKTKKLKIIDTWYPKSSLTYYKLDDIYSSFEVGKTYVVETIGFDIPYLGVTESIIEFEAAK